MSLLDRIFGTPEDPKEYKVKIRRRSRLKGKKREKFLEEGREMPDLVKLARIPKDPGD